MYPTISGNQKSGVPYREWELKKFEGRACSTLIFAKGEQKMGKLSFYTVDSEYCDYLRVEDPCVPHTHDSKANRPFVGIVLEVGEFKYYAPLSSPKPKHLSMHNQVDFLKIDGGVYGVINFNNMIPIHDNSLIKIIVNVLPTDNEDEIAYKKLLANQLTWCNANRDSIGQKAGKLYNMFIDGRIWDNLKSRCCNFTLDEQRLGQYISLKGWD